MTDHGWHLDHDLVERYASGLTGRVTSASVEQHLVGCSSCRGLLAPYADPVRSGRIWDGVVERVQAPVVRPVERALRACGTSDTTARLLAVTPSLRGSWLVGVVLVLVIAELAASSSPGGIAVFVALAPVLPVISVAAAFGGEMDRAREMVAAAPYPPVRLLLVRTLAVVATTVLPATGLALLVPGSTLLAMGWLLPSLALAGTVLVLTPQAPALPTAAVLAGAWMTLVAVGWLRHHDPYVATSAPVQLTSALVLVTTLGVLTIRRESFAEAVRGAA
jgi:hypothetical protein